MNNTFGSVARDKFRWLHKFYDKLCDLSNTNVIETQTWWACDGDLFLMSSGGKPIALLDYQRYQQSFTMTEVKLYDWILSMNVPVFAIIGNNPDWLTYNIIKEVQEGLFFTHTYPLPNYQVYKYIKGGATEFVTNDYIEWERNLRKNKSIYNKDL